MVVIRLGPERTIRESRFRSSSMARRIDLQLERDPALRISAPALRVTSSCPNVSTASHSEPSSRAAPFTHVINLCCRNFCLYVIEERTFPAPLLTMEVTGVPNCYHPPNV